MTIEFRCAHCGSPLSVQADEGSTIRCAHCRRKVQVPAGLASLPRPHVPPDAAPAAEQNTRPRQPAEVDGHPVIASMAGIMPWVLSLLLHMGVFMIMLFLVMIVARPTRPEHVPVPDFAWSENPGGPMGFTRDPVPDRSTDRSSSTLRREYRREDRVADSGITQQRVEIYAPSLEGNRGGADEPLGLRDTGNRSGPGVGFGGLGGNAHHVVLVVDRSGSMVADFEEVVREMGHAIGRMVPIQDFHIILFADNRTIEGPGRLLTAADDDGKRKAARFLLRSDIRPGGRTTALVALQRAFEVLQHADPDRPGKLVYLLTDGDFAGMTGGSTYLPRGGRVLRGNEAVVQWLRDHNADRDVQINTLLFRRGHEQARRVLGTIAADSGGNFKYISPDE